MYRRLVCLVLAGLACAALGCSPKVVAGDASAGVDAVDVGVFDSLGDLADGGGEGIADAVGDGDADGVLEDAVEVGEIADAITDATLEVAEVDAAEVETTADTPEVDSAGEVTDVPDVITDVPDVPLPSDCTGDALLPPPDATVLVDVGPVVPNKVVTGCGKGKPEPVAQGTECCDCPPPYSCYCNGECAWLRTPDLHAQHSGGKGGWTGKWVVAMTNMFVGFNDKLEAVSKVFVERWNPASSSGFLLSAHPDPDIIDGQLRLFVVGGKVLVTSEGLAPTAGSGLGPKRPAYWYDPETDNYESIVMPSCSGLVATATHLACCDGGFGGDKGAVHLYDVAAKSWSKVKAPAGLLPPGKSICWASGEDLIADAGNLYFIAPVSIFGTDVWPDGSKASDGGHVIRYDIPGGSWKDLGSVPTDLLKSREFIVPISGNILFGVTAAGLKLGLFDLATGKTKIVESSIPFQSNRQVVATACGVYIATGDYDGPPGPTGQTKKYRVPAFVHTDLSVELFPNWGYPSDDRGITTALKTDKELLVLGGYSSYDHQDGYRYPLSQVCKGAKP